MDRRRNPPADAAFGPVCGCSLFGAGTRTRCRRGRLTLSRVLGFLLYAHVDVRSSVHRRTLCNARVGFPALLITRDEALFAGRILLGHRFWRRAALPWAAAQSQYSVDPVFCLNFWLLARASAPILSRTHYAVFSLDQSVPLCRVQFPVGTTFNF